MVKRIKKEDPQPAELNPTQLKAAIPKLERRIKELKDIDCDTIQKQREHRFESLKNNEHYANAVEDGYIHKNCVALYSHIYWGSSPGWLKFIINQL